MKMQRIILATLSIILVVVLFPAKARKEDGSETLSGDSILWNLAQKQDEDLNKFISFLSRNFHKLHLSEGEIDCVIEKLREIQQSDPYQIEASGKGGKGIRHPNKALAGQCIPRIEFLKTANQLRVLPLEERVGKIIEGLDAHPFGYYGGELSVLGKEAVPFIIQHRPKQPYACRVLIQILIEFGDPKAIPFINDVLETKDEGFSHARPVAAKALGNFDGDAVIGALISALKDTTCQDIDRHLPQAIPTPKTHKPYIGKYYSVQHAASQSLSKITGHDWGWVYNEDYKTWLAWFEKANDESFSPRTIERTDKEIRALIEHLFDRYMSARPNPWQPQNDLATFEGIKSISEDLEILGASVASILLQECDTRISRYPVWSKELQAWTKKLLFSLQNNETSQSAECMRLLTNPANTSSRRSSVARAFQPA